MERHKCLSCWVYKVKVYVMFIFLLERRGMFYSISFANKTLKGTPKRLSLIYFFQSSLYPSGPVVFFQRTLYIKLFILCNPPFPGDCLAPLSQHGNGFNTNPGNRHFG